jgi:uncharacterized RDD family membrane protein YckC
MSTPPGSPRGPDRTAGIVTRALAAAVDAAVVLVMMGVALLCAAGVRFLVSPISFRWPSPSWPLSLAVGAALATAYLAIAWATSGRSCGAAVVGVRVRSVGGDPLGWVRALLRATLCVAFPPGLLWCVLSRRRRSVQDVVLRSLVVYDWDDDAGIRVRPPAAVSGPASPVHPVRMGGARWRGGHRGRPSAREAQR